MAEEQQTNSNEQNPEQNSPNYEEKGKQVIEKVEESLSDAVDKTQEIIHAENKKVLAGVLAILFGGLGIHKFVLGYTTEGIIQIVISIVTCGIGSILGLIEGIIYLTKSDDEFYQMYQVNKKGWF